MTGRVLLAGAAMMVGAVAVGATAAEAANGGPQPDDPFRVSCEGTMIAGDAPEGPVMTDGMVDFRAMRVSGFGIGGQPILRVTDSVVFFGSAITGSVSTHPSITGRLDRMTGAARIVVSGKSGERLIAMRLTCRMAPMAF